LLKWRKWQEGGHIVTVSPRWPIFLVVAGGSSHRATTRARPELSHCYSQASYIYSQFDGCKRFYCAEI